MATAIKYTNGYNVDEVLSALMNRRRWRQPTRSDFTITLASPNVWANDDLNSPVFESGHKIVSPYYIWKVQEDEAINAEKFNAYLQNLQKDVILKCLNNVFCKNEFLEKKLMFDRFGRNDYVNQNTGAFVGVRITPSATFDVTVQIDSVSLLFDSNATFNLYLFHDSQPKVPLKTISVTAVANVQKVVSIGEFLSYSGVGKKGGAFYLGYFQDDLGEAKAINEIVQKFNTTYNFGVLPVELQKAGDHTINQNSVAFTIKSHGFNIQLSAFRDKTQLIVDNAYLFDNLINLQMAADVIELIQNSTRTNKDQRITQELSRVLYTDLNQSAPTGEAPFVPGLKHRISKEVQRVSNEFYPKQKATSITHDTMNKNIYGQPAEGISINQY